MGPCRGFLSAAASREEREHRERQHDFDAEHSHHSTSLQFLSRRRSLAKGEHLGDSKAGAGCSLPLPVARNVALPSSVLRSADTPEAEREDGPVCPWVISRQVRPPSCARRSRCGSI